MCKALGFTHLYIDYEQVSHKVTKNAIFIEFLPLINIYL